MYGRARANETVEVKHAAARFDDAITAGELEDARLGFFHLLSRRFGRDFKERHGDDLFAQAAYEFSRKLEQGEEIRNPAAWITHCAWNRAKTEMEARQWRPQMVPTDNLPIEPVAEPSWQPEDSFLSEDRMRKVRQAVDQLPSYQRELLARHYFEGESVREASRKLGWSEGKGARAHNAARKKLRAIFDGLQSSDIKLEVGLAAFFSLSAAGRSAAADVPGGLEAALQRIGHAASDGWHRVADLARHPLGGGRSADISNVGPKAPGPISQLSSRIATSPVAETVASAGDGPGRVAEVCKVLAMCAVSGTAAVTVAVVGAGTGSQHGGAAAATSPAPRHSEERPRIKASSNAPVHAPVAEDHVVEAAVPTHPDQPSGGKGTAGASVSHSISGSRPTVATARKDHQAPAEVDEAEEESSSREAFSAFEGRGDAEADVTESSSAQAQSLSDATTSSSPAEAADPSPPSSPKETSEKQAAGEQFGGPLR